MPRLRHILPALAFALLFASLPPTLALDLPLRVLAWQDGAGAAYLTRSTGQDIATRVFARHGIAQPEAAQAGTERFLAELARQATE